MSPEFEKLHRLMSDAKCSLILNKSRKRVKHIIGNDIKETTDIDIKRFVKYELVRKLSDLVVTEAFNNMTKTTTDLGDAYELDLVVIPTSDLKMVVDYLVQNMELEDLLRIREYGK